MVRKPIAAFAALFGMVLFVFGLVSTATASPQPYGYAFAAECNGEAVTISGTAGDDVIVGTEGDDVIKANRV